MLHRRDLATECRPDRPPPYTYITNKYIIIHDDDGGADMAITLSRCVNACVCVSTRKRKKNPDRNDLKLGTVVVLESPLILGSKGQWLGTQGHHFELLATPSYR